MRVKVLAMIMAGGIGTRLMPLTRERAKPAVPFGGKYRIIDFVLSNMINSGIFSIYVLTQYKSQSLLNHLKDGWQFTNLLKDQFIIPVPAQMRSGEVWYQGTADAIYQNINLIENCNPDVVAIFGADHVFRMDVSQMIEFHLQRQAAVTVAALPMPEEESQLFGVIQCNKDSRIVGFQEKPERPATIPGKPDQILASMGNYIFDTPILLQELYADAGRSDSTHDFGKTILPDMCTRCPVFAYDFSINRIAGEPPEKSNYWRDVGTLDAYYEANMDLKTIVPQLNLYNPKWPLRTANYNDPPAKFAFDEEGRRGTTADSIVSEGCIISGGTVRNSILGRNVFVHSWAEVDECIIMDRCNIGRHARLRRAIIDKNVRIAPHTEIGYNHDEDRKKYLVTDSGIVLVGGEPSVLEVSSLAI
ncbi:MAG: glucose-1-phosphate adenylyltransferase [Acidobacteriia bacterium]|nr:glucose-1-phosphate adenylyltransferase [Terriglobia bacterium]